MARPWKGQLYADDLSGAAPSAQGLQRSIDIIRAYSLRWGWTLNVTKTAVLVCGPETVRAALAAVRAALAILANISAASYSVV